MATSTSTISPPSHNRASGRWMLAGGILLALLAIVLFVVQFSLKQLIVPWYVPAMTTIGVVLVLRSAFRRVTVLRILAVAIIGVLAGLEWHFLVSLTRLPAYEGPAVAGAKMPPFRTSLADGSSFTEENLRNGKRTVMTFFRGRW